MNQSVSVATSKEVSTNQDPTVAKPIKAMQLIFLSLEMLLALPLGLAIAMFHVGGIDTLKRIVEFL